MVRKYSGDRISLAQELAEGLRNRGFWVPRDYVGPDIISAIFLALDKGPSGRWQKEMPAKPGEYYVANRDGEMAGTLTVYESEGVLRQSQPCPWMGWWWSEPLSPPPSPPKWSTPPDAGGHQPPVDDVGGHRCEDQSW